MGGHLASISHSSRNFLAKIREMCVKCPFLRYKRGRFGKKPRFTVKGVKVLENRLTAMSRGFESHTLRQTIRIRKNADFFVQADAKLPAKIIYIVRCIAVAADVFSIKEI